jgi:hypothetical protein
MSSAATLEDLLSQLSAKRQEQWAAIERLNETARAYHEAGVTVRTITSEMEKLSERVMDTVSEITKPDGDQPSADMMTLERSLRAIRDAGDVSARAKIGTRAQVAAETIAAAHGTQDL